MRKMLTLCLALYGANAAALSCLGPRPASLYDHDKVQEQRSVIVLGTIRPDPERWGFFTRFTQVPYTSRATVSGLRLTAEGFSEAFEDNIIVRHDCSKLFWCGALPEGERIFFFQKRLGRLKLFEGFCADTFFWPDPETIAALEACAEGGDCSYGLPKEF